MVLDNEIVVGNVLANKINDFFIISITNEITPLQPESTKSQFEFNESNIHPQFIIDEESVYNKLSDICVSIGNRQVQTASQIGYLNIILMS